MSDVKKEGARKGVTGFFKQDCEFADFLPKMREILKENKADVVCVGFEKDPNTGTHFHSTLLPARMSKDEYKNIFKENKKGLKGALRLSVYVKKELSVKIKQSRSYNCNYSVDGAGAMSFSFMLDEKLITIINGYISFDQESIKLARKSPSEVMVVNAETEESTRGYGDPMIRQDSLSYANMCYNGMIREMVLKEKQIPDHVILMGDLNYRINQMSLTAEMMSGLIMKTSETSILSLLEEYYKKDELFEQISKGNIYNYSEGVDGVGPRFPPTCIMKKNRDCETDFVGCWENQPDYILPSWCNRILYKSYGSEKMCCLKYDRFDHGKTIKKSDHSAVYGVYQIGNCGGSSD